MLMSKSDRAARIHYMANGFRVLTPGDHVVCGVSGARIAIEDLRYWDVASQRAFASAALATEAMAPQ
ncbi:DUF2093 domain-containing protein [Sphingomonas dokdonensis]|jgi:hypothetical protein|uniref:DUF2093 domain-containing protein n=1 Tax=Sphingomonas dokdonensis TaxID=344880 RepID=A0A245ZDE1_9SPHN|nr:DUF2093 domain-containing protein [Sphingomonas dokdonensis]OWK27723.1 hypothetical protein SPDO_30860 [Sphingomonas dokdonensis]